jgi:hypothetical protein
VQRSPREFHTGGDATRSMFEEGAMFVTPAALFRRRSRGCDHEFR